MEWLSIDEFDDVMLQANKDIAAFGTAAIEVRKDA